MEQIVQLNNQAKLSEHFTLGEFTRSGSHPEARIAARSRS